MYATDAEIEYYKLRSLEDDLKFFPSYQAVILYRKDLEIKYPEVLKQLNRLAGLINETEMISMNADVKLNRIPESIVAAHFLSRKFGWDISEKQEITKFLPFSPPYYPLDILTDHPERFFVSELIREKVFDRFFHEIPYATEVVIEEYRERTKGKDYISAVILVERKSQKGILIGKSGEAIRSIGAAARKEIEQFLDRKIFLELRVKVNENWRKDAKKLKQLGY